MTRIGAFITLLALTSCSKSDPPPAPVVHRPAAPAQAPPPPPPPVQPVVPLSEPPQPKTHEVVRQRESIPLAKGLTGNIHLPAFTFRSVTGGVTVQINGEFLGSGILLWSITDGLEFDPKIPVVTWPPEGAEKIGSTRHEENGSAEVWLDQSDGVAKRYSHLRPGESVLYVDGTLGGKKVRGALRLFVEGCKQVFYTPLVNPEGEEASRFLRTIWFDRKFDR